MDRGELVKHLISWHENDEHQTIIESVEKLPRNLWDFEISGLYARALNNVGRYEEAMDQLFMFEEEGSKDGVWNFRVGYSLYYLNRESEAAEYFQRAVDFGDDAEDTREMLRRSIFEAAMKTLFLGGITLLEGDEKRVEKIQDKFDEIMTGINTCRNKYFPNDIHMMEIVKAMVQERVIDLIEYFSLDIDCEILMRKLEGI